MHLKYLLVAFPVADVHVAEVDAGSKYLFEQRLVRSNRHLSEGPLTEAYCRNQKKDPNFLNSIVMAFLDLGFGNAKNCK